MSIFSQIGNTLGGIFGYDTAGDRLGDLITGTDAIKDTAGNVVTAASPGLFSSPSVLSGLLTGGAQLFGQLSTNDANAEAIKRQSEDKKLQYLLELAKLKYGNQGGGGSTRNKNADIIEAMSKGTDQKLQALNQLQSGYLGALR